MNRRQVAAVAVRCDNDSVVGGDYHVLGRLSKGCTDGRRRRIVGADFARAKENRLVRPRNDEIVFFVAVLLQTENLIRSIRRPRQHLDGVGKERVRNQLSRRIQTPPDHNLRTVVGVRLVEVRVHFDVARSVGADGGFNRRQNVRVRRGRPRDRVFISEPNAHKAGRGGVRPLHGGRIANDHRVNDCHTAREGLRTRNRLCARLVNNDGILREVR